MSSSREGKEGGKELTQAKGVGGEGVVERACQTGTECAKACGWSVMLSRNCKVSAAEGPKGDRQSAGRRLVGQAGPDYVEYL